MGSVLHVFVGNVVDAAFATRGEAHYGSRAQAGAIAHLPVEDSREPCSCGRTGCLEAAVSERTITRRAHELGIIPAPDIRLLLGPPAPARGTGPRSSCSSSARGWSAGPWRC